MNDGIVAGTKNALEKTGGEAREFVQVAAIAPLRSQGAPGVTGR